LLTDHQDSPRLTQEYRVTGRTQLLQVLNLSVVTFCVMLGLSMVAPILPSYVESFQVSYAMVGLVISAFAATRMILDMPAGFLGKRYDKRGIMIAGLLLIVTSSVMAGTASTYAVLIIARMIEGAGSALYVTTATVFLAQIAGTERRGRLMSVYSGLLLLGSVFGPSFGGVIATTYDIRTPFFAYAIAAGLGVLPTLILPKPPKSESHSPEERQSTSLQDAWEVLRYPSFLVASMATFTLFFIRTGVRSTIFPLFAANNLGLDIDTIGFLLTFAGLATACTMVPIGDLSDRIGRRNPLIASLLLSAVFTLWIPLSTGLLAITIAMIAYGAGVGMSGPIAAYVTDVSPPDKLEVSMALYRTISDIGFVIGPLLLGYLADLSVSGASASSAETAPIGLLPFVVASIIMVITGLIMFKADDPIRKQNGHASNPKLLQKSDSIP
jgi:DHA1 family multidrug resistance protein-like MFS transporter